MMVPKADKWKDYRNNLQKQVSKDYPQNNA